MLPCHVIKFTAASAAVHTGYRVIEMLFVLFIAACSHRLRGHGNVTSPMYPMPYQQHVYCTWRISTKRGSKVRLHFKEFDVERTESCEFDYIEVHSGHKTEDSSLIGRFCGSKRPDDIITGIWYCA